MPPVIWSVCNPMWPVATYANTSAVQKIRYRMKAVNGGLTEANAVLLFLKALPRPAAGRWWFGRMERLGLLMLVL